MSIKAAGIGLMGTLMLSFATNATTLAFKDNESTNVSMTTQQGVLSDVSQNAKNINVDEDSSKDIGVNFNKEVYSTTNLVNQIKKSKRQNKYYNAIKDVKYNGGMFNIFAIKWDLTVTMNDSNIEIPEKDSEEWNDFLLCTGQVLVDKCIYFYLKYLSLYCLGVKYFKE